MLGTRVVVDLLMAAGADCLLETVFAGFGYGARALALFFDFAVFGIVLYHLEGEDKKEGWSGASGV
jgi:hypothetical protein